MKATHRMGTSSGEWNISVQARAAACWWAVGGAGPVTAGAVCGSNSRGGKHCVFLWDWTTSLPFLPPLSAGTFRMKSCHFMGHLRLRSAVTPQASKEQWAAGVQHIPFWRQGRMWRFAEHSCQGLLLHVREKHGQPAIKAVCHSGCLRSAAFSLGIGSE